MRSWWTLLLMSHCSKLQKVLYCTVVVPEEGDLSFPKLTTLLSWTLISFTCAQNHKMSSRVNKGKSCGTQDLFMSINVGLYWPLCWFCLLIFIGVFYRLEIGLRLLPGTVGVHWAKIKYSKHNVKFIAGQYIIYVGTGHLCLSWIWI